MCKISYERCVCFVFLVILAVLSCSGFRIDNLAMTDISKRNSHTSTSLLSSDGAFATHRIRHHRQLRAPRAPPAPPSSEPRRHQSKSERRRGRKECPELDVSWKAYMAHRVVVARAESRSSNCKENCTVQFVVEKDGWLKNRPDSNDTRFKLNFRSGKKKCDYEDWPNNTSDVLVRTKINQGKKYILFLNTQGPHNYTAAFVPEPFKKRTQKTVLKVGERKINAQNVKLEKFEHFVNSTRLKLSCKVRAFPIPMIYWKRNNTLLHPSPRQKITQKNEGKDRKKSTLTIRKPIEADSRRYECFVRVDGTEITEEFPTKGKIDTGTSCNEPMKSTYCLNGGTCFYLVNIDEYSCECANGYSGHHCDQKLSDQSSMYRQTPITPCKIGLYTKYDNC